MYITYGIKYHPVYEFWCNQSIALFSGIPDLWPCKCNSKHDYDYNIKVTDYNYVYFENNASVIYYNYGKNW